MLIDNILNWLHCTSHTSPLPDELWCNTFRSLPFLARLNDDERLRLRCLTEKFLTQKEFSSAGGLVLTDAICVSIATQGCLPILNLGLENYRDWVGIVVYPDEFVIPRRIEDEYGIVHEYDDIASGEAWEGGPLLISWRDVQMAGSGYNVVIHEFAHKLDMLNGPADGHPPLPISISRQTWRHTLLQAYENFCTRIQSADESGKEMPFDDYAAESPAEFFAVMSEAFFEMPTLLHDQYPRLYEQFHHFYRQDPARHE